MVFMSSNSIIQMNIAATFRAIKLAINGSDTDDIAVVCDAISAKCILVP